jgi:large subunit ribosomal protein L21
MYAVIQTGGKQYRVAKGQVLKIEKLEADLGTEIQFDQVLLVGEGESVQVGAPLLKNKKVVAKVLEQGRHKKIKIIKFRRRKHFDKQMGHRQYFTKVEITDIQ